jgi:putative transposase
MKRKRHSAEAIIKYLRQAAQAQAKGEKIEDICRGMSISVATYHRWQKQYRGMGDESIKRLKQLEKENARLKKLVADQALDMAILKEVAQGKW